jgi:biotin operon repressor
MSLQISEMASELLALLSPTPALVKTLVDELGIDRAEIPVYCRELRRVGIHVCKGSGIGGASLFISRSDWPLVERMAREHFADAT